jgi:flagellar motility protein MotE (MotC chaperone)
MTQKELKKLVKDLKKMPVSSIAAKFPELNEQVHNNLKLLLDEKEDAGWPALGLDIVHVWFDNEQGK